MLHRGWIGGCEVGDSPGAPPGEVPVGCEGAGKCRRWGGERGKGGGRTRDVLEHRDRAGSGRCPTGVQGGQQRGHRGAGLCGFGAARSREALASFMHCR